jgi:hypothetical protein
MSPDNRTAPDTTSPGDQPALDADPAHRLTVTGLGGAGARLLWDSLTALHRAGLVEIDGEDESELYSGTDTTGYNFVEYFDTTGCRKSPRDYSRQYQQRPSATRRSSRPCYSPTVATKLIDQSVANSNGLSAPNSILTPMTSSRSR